MYRFFCNHNKEIKRKMISNLNIPKKLPTHTQNHYHSGTKCLIEHVHPMKHWVRRSVFGYLFVVCLDDLPVKGTQQTPTGGYKP